MLCSRHGKEFPQFSGHWSLVRCALTADSGTTDHILFINTSVSFIENTKAKALTQNPRACELVKCLESQDMSPKVPFRCCGHCSQICMSTKQGTLLQLQSHTSNCPILGSWKTNDSLWEVSWSLLSLGLGSHQHSTEPRHRSPRPSCCFWCHLCFQLHPVLSYLAHLCWKSNF